VGKQGQRKEQERKAGEDRHDVIHF
jgi:hypothetical protein